MIVVTSGGKPFEGTNVGRRHCFQTSISTYVRPSLTLLMPNVRSAIYTQTYSSLDQYASSFL